MKQTIIKISNLIDKLTGTEPPTLRESLHVELITDINGNKKPIRSTEFNEILYYNLKSYFSTGKVSRNIPPEIKTILKNSYPIISQFKPFRSTIKQVIGEFPEFKTFYVGNCDLIVQSNKNLIIFKFKTIRSESELLEKEDLRLDPRMNLYAKTFENLIPHIHMGYLLFKSYEPFTCKQIITEYEKIFNFEPFVKELLEENRFTVRNLKIKRYKF